VLVRPTANRSPTWEHVRFLLELNADREQETGKLFS